MGLDVSQRNDVALKETIAQVGTNPTRASTVVSDIRVPEDRDRLINCGIEQPGVLFGLVNNACLARAESMLDEYLDDWRDILETNLEAAYFLSQKAIEHMRPRHEGRIVNIASVYGFAAFDNRGYGARAPETSEGDRGPSVNPPMRRATAGSSI